MVIKKKTVQHLPWRKIARWSCKRSAKIYKKIYGDEERSRKGKDRKNRKHTRMQNKKICKKYPWLIPRDIRGNVCWVDCLYDGTELDDMPSGWRKAFGDIWCEEIQKVLKKNNFVQKFRIVQLKEKFGQLRCYTNGHPEELSDLIWKFERISENICIQCGKLDSPVINVYGWFEPLCKDCYNKLEYKSKAPYEELIDEYSKQEMILPTSMCIKTYSNNKYNIKILEFSDLTKKIRYKNRKRRSNVDELYE